MIVLGVGPQWTFSSTGARFRTPVGVPTLTEFLRRIGNKAKDYRQKEITVLISAIVATELGFPLSIHHSPKFLEPVRVFGFKVSKEMFPFIAFHSHKEYPNIHLGITPWMETEDAKVRERRKMKFPLYFRDDIPGSLALMAQWQEKMGAAYRGGPGINALAAAVNGYDPRSATCPSWKPKNQPDTPPVTDPPFTPNSWLANGMDVAAMMDVDKEYLDMNGAYLGRYIAQPLPRYGLTHTGKIPHPWVMNAKKQKTPLGGWFLITPSPWNTERMPNPAGPDVPNQPREDGTFEPILRTAPTLALLDELKEMGVYGGYTIEDSWTSKAYTVLRPVGEKLRDIIYSDDLPEALVITAKASAQELHGMLAREDGMVVRSEWYATIRASCRTILWRRSYQAGMAEDIWPLYFKIDAAFYAAGLLPSTAFFPRTATLGGFKVKPRQKGEKL